MVDSRAAARYAEVAVQLPVRGTYSYGVPARVGDRPLVGVRVLVPFGGRGVTGVVVGTDAARPDAAVERVLDIQEVLDDRPLIDPELLALCRWIADYYEAPPGEVLRAALPVGSEVRAARWVRLTDAGRLALAGDPSAGALSRVHRDLLGRLDGGGGAVAHKALTRGRARAADVAALVDAGLAEYAQSRREARVRARTERVAVLGPELSRADPEALATLARAKRQREVVDALIAAGGRLAVAALAEQVPHASTHVRALARANLITIEEREVRRSRWVAETSSAMQTTASDPPQLTPAQAEALSAISDGLSARDYRGFLLHGITGSGKTEVYLRVIGEALAQGRTAVVLVPEISLTPQLAARFRARFGDDVAILHSGLSDGERFDEWHRLQRGSARIAVGARSAVFAPVRDVGVIVVDEEHDPSFKQEEGVRYSARDVALVRAQRAGAVCILGSATPSLESYHNAHAGRLGLLRLPERATPKPLPEVELIDLRVYQPEGDAMLTAPLRDAIRDTLRAGDQAILFLNRRGFATFVLCVKCGHAFRCPNCSVSLTYHRARDRLACHYCGHEERVAADCPSCGGVGSVARRGLGTERIADGIARRFPQARVARLDRDTASGQGVQRILGRFARREVDVLVGTQMVTKGHDFPGVTLVGVLCADTGLSLPDFRAGERTFQLLTQVAGRAGRGDRPGRVVIQTYRPDAISISAAMHHDYEAFYRAETGSRRELGYPPFGHLIALRLDGPDAGAVSRAARTFGERAASSSEVGGGEVTVLGPSEAPLARLKGRTRWHLWLRAPERKPLRRLARELASAADFGSVRVTVDVDPVSAL